MFTQASYYTFFNLRISKFKCLFNKDRLEKANEVLRKEVWKLEVGRRAGEEVWEGFLRGEGEIGHRRET